MHGYCLAALPDSDAGVILWYFTRTMHLKTQVFRDAARLLRAALWVWLATSGCAARAAPVQGLYEAEVPVSDQSEAARAPALRAALAQVLVKVSGLPAAAKAPGLAAVLKVPARRVQQYRYESAAPEPVAPDAVAGEQSAPPPAPQLMLWARFDPAALDRALTDAGLPIWKNDRPLVLVWAAVQNGGQRMLAGPDLMPDLYDQLRRQAQRRGIPLLFPLLDLQDVAHLQPGEVWAGFQEPIMEASQRYHPAAVLTARLLPDAAGWSAHWTLYLQGRASGWDTKAPGLQEVVAGGIDGVADALAARFALAGDVGADQSLVLEVAGVDSIEQYATAQRYLAGLTPVTNIAPVAIDPSGVSFALRIRGSAQDLQQAIGVGSALVPEGSAATAPGAPGSLPSQSPAARPTPTTTLYYRLAR